MAENEIIAPLFVVDKSMVVEEGHNLVFRTSDNRIWTVPVTSVGAAVGNRTDPTIYLENVVVPADDDQDRLREGNEQAPAAAAAAAASWDDGETPPLDGQQGEEDEEEMEKIEYSALFSSPGEPVFNPRKRKANSTPTTVAAAATTAAAAAAPTTTTTTIVYETERKSKLNLLLKTISDSNSEYFLTKEWVSFLFPRVLTNPMFFMGRRLQTFSNWTVKNVCCGNLARAGFVLPRASKNVVVCFVNGCHVSALAPKDIAWRIHSQTYPECPYVQIAAPAIFQYQENERALNDINRNDSSYYFVRLASLEKFKNVLSLRMRRRLAGAGFIGGKHGNICCFLCNAVLQENLEVFERGRRKYPMKIHAGLNFNCPFVRMIGG